MKKVRFENVLTHLAVYCSSQPTVKFSRAKHYLCIMEKHFNELPESRQQQLMAFDRLLTIMDELREQCPWDRKQTMDSLRHLTIEETYELSDAILENDLPEIKKELGDVLLHIVFYAKIASENNPDLAPKFDIKDVLHGICEKLISRHPHIYGDAKADTEEQVKQNWEKLKLKEGNKSVLSGVPASLPALVKAMRIQEKARGAGFDWDEKQQVWEKVEEELQEFKENFNIESHEVIDQNEAEAEFGDLLFSLVNYSRFVDINPETALERTNKKFIRRFQYMEEASKADGKSLTEMTLTEMDEYWNQAKALKV
jgi:XTP/dITP diphosphohydrolase